MNWIIVEDGGPHGVRKGKEIYIEISSNSIGHIPYQFKPI
jgi:hypothetical protein